MLVQHVGHVPESLPVTEETSERLREQANQLPESTVIRLIDLLAIAVDDARQGGDPRLPLELAIVKVTRPQADLSRDSLAHRLELLEARPVGAILAGSRRDRQPRSRSPRPRTRRPTTRSGTRSSDERPPSHPTSRPSSSISSATPGDGTSSRLSGRTRSRSRRSSPRHVPSSSTTTTLTIEFAPAAGFHRAQIEEPKNLTLLSDALYEVTGRRLRVETTIATAAEPSEPEDRHELSEEDVISLLKDTFDAEEVEDR